MTKAPENMLRKHLLADGLVVIISILVIKLLDPDERLVPAWVIAAWLAGHGTYLLYQGISQKKNPFIIYGIYVLCFLFLLLYLIFSGKTL